MGVFSFLFQLAGHAGFPAQLVVKDWQVQTPFDSSPEISQSGRVNNPLALPAEGTKMPPWSAQLIFGHPKFRGMNVTQGNQRNWNTSMNKT